MRECQKIKFSPSQLKADSAKRLTHHLFSCSFLFVGTHRSLARCRHPQHAPRPMSNPVGYLYVCLPTHSSLIIHHSLLTTHHCGPLTVDR